MAEETTTAAAPSLRTGRGGVVWLTGLSGAGKTTLAEALARRLTEVGRAHFILDGDVLRRGLCRDLGFSPSDRAEHIRRAAEVAAIGAGAGLVVIAAFIAPYAAGRAEARRVVTGHADLFGRAPSFYEVFVDAPLAICEARDVKGLYARARRGELSDFTGIDAPYEAPASPDLHLRTDELSVSDGAAAIFDLLMGDDEVLGAPSRQRGEARRARGQGAEDRIAPIAGGDA